MDRKELMKAIVVATGISLTTAAATDAKVRTEYPVIQVKPSGKHGGDNWFEDEKQGKGDERSAKLDDDFPPGKGKGRGRPDHHPGRGHGYGHGKGHDHGHGGDWPHYY